MPVERTVAGLNDDQMEAYCEGLIRVAGFYDELANYDPSLPSASQHRDAAFENRKRARELVGQ